MKIEELRVYAEVLEQGIDFRQYLSEICPAAACKNIYTKKVRAEIFATDSLVTRIRKSKDVDVLITAISSGQEYPLLMVEYSTAVPTDDHKMQRSDVYYWGSKYKVAMMKIYPSKKGMEQEFGGGDKFTDDAECAISYLKGGIFYPVQWETIAGSDILRTKENALSCIYHCRKINDILENIVTSFIKNADYPAFFNTLREKYKNENKDILNIWTTEKLKGLITNSSRFKWQGQKLISKINRFGHAMDPDRGILYFSSMLIGKENCITEIQVNRTSVNERQGYRSLFDLCPRETQLRAYVEDIVKNKGNKFTVQDAIHILSYALCIENYDLFKQAGEREFVIEDDKLTYFLINCPSITSKCIFFLSTTLLLTDARRDIICKISWNADAIDSYLDSLLTVNTMPIQIAELNDNDAKEDIITYASCELYKKIGCNLLAVSYPGAQGDRCILNGEGRNVLRTYIDIIALKKTDNQSVVLLEECKDALTRSKADVDKLNSILRDEQRIRGLNILVEKLSADAGIGDVKISVGAKYTNKIPPYDVDYIFMFSICSQGNYTYIDYYIALTDTTLVGMFAPLMNEQGKLKGTLVLDKLYIIDE